MSSLEDRLRQALAPEYRVEGELARGGSAIVFLATDATLERTVAIKVLRPELATARGAARFLREARLLALVAHPNVVPVHRAGESGGLFYYVMEHLQGETLRSRLDRGPLPPAEAVDLVRQLLAALVAAHDAELVHRDVKPANVLIVGRRALLTDFGIASSTGAPASEGPANVGLGTPGYMAPEQAEGGPATPATDIYAAAMILYEAVTGRKWSLATSTEDADWSEVPPPLIPILRRALAPDPAGRWPDAASLRDALSNSARRKVGGRRLVIASLVAVAALIGTAAVLVVQKREVSGSARALADLAVLPCVPSDERDSARARSVARIAALDLSMMPGLKVRSPFTSFHWWTRPGVVRRPQEAPSALHARRATSCVLAHPAADTLEARLDLYDADGHRMPSSLRVRGPAVDPPQALGDSLALALLGRLGRTVSAGGISELGGLHVQAVAAFLQGEEAFEAGDWALADSAYSTALAIDDRVALARWRLADVHRWELAPTGVDLTRLWERDAGDLPPLDRRLLEARVAPPGPRQFALYQAILRDYPHDAYATMLYADELYHRGPLWGLPLDSAEEVLELAVARDSFFQPTLEQLAWARIRLGEREPAATTVRRLEALDTASPGETATTTRIAAQAWRERFAPDSAPAGRRALFGAHPDPAALLHWSRLAGPYLDLDRSELGLGEALVAVSGTGSRERLSGHLAQGLALMAEGRPGAALAHFDSAAILSGDDEGTVQASSWPVVLAALDVPGVAQDRLVAARDRLRELAASGSTEPVARRQAAWTLALDAYRRLAVPEGDRWARTLGEPTMDSVAGRLRLLLDAVALAARDDLEGGLETSASLLAYDSAGSLEAPFARSVLHLLRAEWQSRLNRPAAALASLTWQESSDLEGAPGEVRYASPLVQAGEVDWALGTVGRLRGAEAALDAGRRRRACRYAREVLRLWRDPEPAFDPGVERARVLRARACPP